MKPLFSICLAILLCVFSSIVAAENPYITLASTTSTENSGLYGHILPKFTAKTGIDVRVIAVGTGRAIRIAESGDADVLLVHHRESEMRFVAQGFGIRRFDVMYNDFVFIGPDHDPAGIADAGHSIEAMKRIYTTRHIFISRGDDSGTHKKELELWTLAGLDPRPFSGTWYQEVGRGMGATLNIAVAQNAYTLTDRGTWIAFQNKRDLRLLFQPDTPLHNQYGVILVNPQRHPHIKADMGQQFIDWLLSAEGQQSIDDFRLNDQQLFFANATATVD